MTIQLVRDGSERCWSSEFSTASENGRRTRGVGKTTIARLLARAINCTNRGENAEPCNQCSSCLQSLSGSSLDIIEIDGASNNGVEFET